MECIWNENNERLSRFAFKICFFKADIFEKVRNNSWKNYKLCPSHYLSVQALNWDAMLNIKKVELELITDPDIFIFFKKVWEVDFLIFLVAITKPTINIYNLMIQNKNQSILYT